MKSIWGSLGLNKYNNVSAIDGLPKSGSGIIPYREDEPLIQIWIDLIKAEESCRNLKQEIVNYQEAIKKVQLVDENLTKKLSESGVLCLSSKLRGAAEEHFTVAMEIKPKSKEICQSEQEVLSNCICEYHGLYEHLDNFKKARDIQLIEVYKIQEKLDRLKLKCKRTTDVIVEKDKAMMQLKNIHYQLFQETKTFHDFRTLFLLPYLQKHVQLQIDYYGSAATEFNKNINRGEHTFTNDEYFQVMDENLSKLKALKIVNL